MLFNQTPKLPAQAAFKLRPVPEAMCRLPPLTCVK